MISLDGFFDRMYHERNYHCVHFTTEVWKALTGQDLQAAFEGLLGAPRERRVRRTQLEPFRRLDRPVSPCIALLRRGRCPPHMGVYKDRRIIHIGRCGVEFQPVDVVRAGFDEVEYYLCK